MSRRKQRAATHGELILQCPHGHTLGSTVLTRHGNVYRLGRPLRDNIETTHQPVAIGKKVRFRCPAC